MLNPRIPDGLRLRASYRPVTPYPVSIRTLARRAARPTLDLRPTIATLGLGVRDQGSRGTCSVFALTFLLEFMYGTRLEGTPADLSEEYLNHVANLAGMNAGDGDFFDNIDAGYRSWGIVPEAMVPYAASPVGTIPQATLGRGRGWTRFQATFIKAWDASRGATAAQLEATIACLDRQVPVGCGGWWFRAGNWGTTVTRGVEVMNVPEVSQKATVLEDGHSVALVGYRRDSAFPGGGYFVFRNSWGGGWGDNGYGYMPFEYVLRFTNDLVAYDTVPLAGGRLGVQAVVRQPDRIDVFAADSTGAVHGASWQQDRLSGRWRGWWPVLGGKARSGGTVAVVARDPAKLDLFVPGTDGKSWTAAWDRNLSDGQWRGWWNVQGGAVGAGSQVTALSRSPHRLDAFLVSTDAGIYTAAWDQHVAAGQWRGWWRIGNGVARSGTDVAAVARSTDQLDVFVVGTNGGIYTAAWDQHVAGAQWRGWWRIGSGVAAPGTSPAALSRDRHRLDVFVVGTDGGIYTAAWDQHFAEAQWRGWWRIGSGVARPGSPVAAVARSPHQLDVFVIGTDGGIWTAAWDQHVSEGQWRGWWRIGTGVARAGSGISAVSRAQGKLDVFVVGLDGGVWTAAWDQQVANGAWRGWWRVGP